MVLDKSRPKITLNGEPNNPKFNLNKKSQSFKPNSLAKVGYEDTPGGRSNLNMDVQDTRTACTHGVFVVELLVKTLLLHCLHPCELQWTQWWVVTCVSSEQRLRAGYVSTITLLPSALGTSMSQKRDESFLSQKPRKSSQWPSHLIV